MASLSRPRGGHDPAPGPAPPGGDGNGNGSDSGSGNAFSSAVPDGAEVAGKTTLLNRILTHEHGLKVAVIVNECGEVGIDNQLVINADEEIFAMNNCCICCTVRGDLIRIIGNLMKRRDRFDHLVIETTGLADPSSVIQSFFVDDDLRDALRLDAVVTLVDLRHVDQTGGPMR
jgi:G3E family GTPase